MARIKLFLICATVLVLVAPNLAQHNEKQANRKKFETNKARKRVQADAPLPSKAKCTCDNE